ncbi:hypothetical protein [Salinisphaera sp. Q1T1-3]|uniref:hypothetical protein n=1 Tax=Salinisphaera sp. Q1T1-3 TaxID=2321229 RepID=UPI000E711E81|nr:hypothetical protein [Salinisphaera sp. Q1T1-3]RJS92486.1 hypothetical protein D3260_11175 [Salinisphaera sp. Q1T1-3]
MASDDTTCRICGRIGVKTTRHHLIPRRTHRQKRIRKRFDRDDRLGRILSVCRPCHSHIHAVLSEKALAEVYNTGEALRAHPDIAAFADWIADKPAGFRPTIRRPKR